MESLLSILFSLRYAHTWASARGRRFRDFDRVRRCRTLCKVAMAFLDLSSAAILAATIGIPWMLIIGFLHLGLSDGPNFSAA